MLARFLMKKGCIFWLDFRKNRVGGLVLTPTHVEFFLGLEKLTSDVKENEERVIFLEKKTKWLMKWWHFGNQKIQLILVKFFCLFWL